MKDSWLSYVGTGVSAIFTAIQENPVYQIISLSLTILSTVVAISYTVWKWYRKAKQDGKITENEIDELMDNVNNIVNKEDKKDE